MSLSLEPLSNDLQTRIRAMLDALDIPVTSIKPLARRDSVIVQLQTRLADAAARSNFCARIDEHTPLKASNAGLTSVTLRLPDEWLPKPAAPDPVLPALIRAVLESIGITDVERIDEGKAADVFVIYLKESRGTDRAWVAPLAKTSLRVLNSSLKSLTVRVPADWLSDAALDAIFEQAKQDAPRGRAVLEALRRIGLTPTALRPAPDVDGEYVVDFIETITGGETTRIVRDTPFVVDAISGPTQIKLGVPRDWPEHTTASADYVAVLTDEIDLTNEATNDIGTDAAPAVTQAIEDIPAPELDPDAYYAEQEREHLAHLDEQDAERERQQFFDENGREPVEPASAVQFIDPVPEPVIDPAEMQSAAARESETLAALIAAQQEAARLREQLTIVTEQRDSYLEIAASYRHDALTVPACKEFRILTNAHEAQLERMAEQGYTCVHFQFNELGALDTVWVRDVSAPTSPDPLAARAEAAIPVEHATTSTASGQRLILDTQPAGALNLSPVMARVMANPTEFPIAHAIATKGLEAAKAEKNAALLAHGQAAYNRLNGQPQPVRPLALVSGDSR